MVEILKGRYKYERTVVIAPTMVMITAAMAEMMALMPAPIAENTDP